MSSVVQTVKWRKKQQREREESIGLCLQESGLERASAESSDLEKTDLERVQGREKVKGKVGYCWVAVIL